MRVYRLLLAGYDRWQPTWTRRWVGALAIVLACVLTITLIDNVYSGQRPVATTAYDGVTVYRALFFADGPLAAKIPTLRKAAPYLPADYKGLENQTIRYLQSTNPQFFDNLASQVQSGDRVKVAAAIRDAGKIQRKALLEVTRTSRARFAPQFQRLGTEREPEAENDANVAVEVLVFVLIFVTVFWESPKARPAALQGLSFDRYVDEVVTAVPTKKLTVRQ